MTARHLLARSLMHYRAVHVAVVLGVAVGAAVLAGSLIVGSSVRGSLRGLTLERLGAIDHAAVGERYFREGVEDAAAWPGKAVSAILVRGSIEHASSGLRASGVRIHGVPDRFWEFFGQGAPPLGTRDVAVNRRLADELGAREGEDILLRFQSDPLVPAESVMGRRVDSVRMIRLRLAAVLPDEGPGRFGLSPRQQLPYNVYTPRGILQRALDQEGRANALFVAGGTLEEATRAWRDVFSAADARLTLAELPQGRGVQVASERVVLDGASAVAVHGAAGDLGLTASEVLTYLANTITAHGRSIPYSTVTALGSTPEDLRLTNGRRAAGLDRGEILLNGWAARDLRVAPGATVSLSYYVVGPDSTLLTESSDFRLAGVVRMSGAAVDRDLAPTYKGMSDRARMASWDPPFPMDLRLIRPRDEVYWDLYRASPKAFVSLADAKDLWASRFGQLTSIRVTAAPGAVNGIEGLRAGIGRRLDPQTLGLGLQPVKQAGLEASTGSTDFSGLFLGFSLFLIVSAAILVVLLFRLGVERRAHEIGVLLATGHSPAAVRLRMLAEGGVLAVTGCLIGIPGAVGCAWLMLYGLRTWWSDAVGGAFLELYLEPADPVAGALGALALMLASIWLSLRRLAVLTPGRLLAGSVEPPSDRAAEARRVRRLVRLSAVLAVLAVALLGVSFQVDAASRLITFFGAGTLTLVASLVRFRGFLLARRRSGSTVAGVAQLGVLNGGRNPTRSMLSAALVACASFMIVTVAMNRHDVSGKEPSLDSGDGGFRLMAESDVPLFGDRIDEVAAGPRASMTVFPLRVRSGDDASCLNLYRPTQPTLLGMPPSLLARGGFSFQGTLAETQAEHGNPWLLLERDFGEAVPVFADANSATWILHLGLGDHLEVTDGNGRQVRLLLAGVLSRSIFQSELLLAETRFLELFPDHSGYQSLLVETEDEAAAGVLEEAFADSGLDARLTANRLAGYLVVENTYLSTFRTLGGLGLLLGTLGLAVVMVRTVLERRGELALLEAVGFSRRAIVRLVYSENALLLLFGVAVGTVAALIAVAPTWAGGATSPPWAPLLGTLGTVLVTGLAAGAVAARLSLRAPLLPSLRRD